MNGFEGALRMAKPFADRQHGTEVGATASADQAV
jgi:hypothetical protein